MVFTHHHDIYTLAPASNRTTGSAHTASSFFTSFTRLLTSYRRISTWSSHEYVVGEMSGNGLGRGLKLAAVAAAVCQRSA